jgi:hypothetical protein
VTGGRYLGHTFSGQLFEEICHFIFDMSDLRCFRLKGLLFLSLKWIVLSNTSSDRWQLKFYRITVCLNFLTGPLVLRLEMVFITIRICIPLFECSRQIREKLKPLAKIISSHQSPFWSFFVAANSHVKRGSLPRENPR